MVIVDTHCHVSPYWYEPVETLLHQMNSNGVDIQEFVPLVARICPVCERRRLPKALLGCPSNVLRRRCERCSKYSAMGAPVA